MIGHPKSVAPSTARTDLLVLLLASFSIYLQVFIIPNVPVVAIGDQSIFLLEAKHLLDGMKIYRDFFEFNSPGTAVCYSALFKILGVRALIPAIALLALGETLFWLTVLISRKVLSGPLSYLPGLLFLTLSFHNMLDATHHWYSTLAVTAALLVLIEKRSNQRLAVAGALCGLASWFTSARGFVAALGFLLFLLWEKWRERQSWRTAFRRMIWLSSTFLSTVLVSEAYFVAQAGWKKFLWCTIVFTLKYYPVEPYNNWRAFLRDLRQATPRSIPLEWGTALLVHLVVPWVYAIPLVWSSATRRLAEKYVPLALIGTQGAFLFLGIAPAPDLYRLCSVSIPAFVVLVSLTSIPGSLRRLARATLWAVVFVLLFLEPIVRQTRWHAVLDFPTGRAACLDLGTFPILEWAYRHVPPSSSFWGDQLIVFVLNLHDSAEVPFVLPNDYTRPEQVRHVIESLERDHAQYVAWGWNLNQPKPSEKGGDHLNPLREYLRIHYHVVATFSGSSRILERNQIGP